jgi:hypothetical protein
MSGGWKRYRSMSQVRPMARWVSGERRTDGVKRGGHGLGAGKEALQEHVSEQGGGAAEVRKWSSRCQRGTCYLENGIHGSLGLKIFYSRSGGDGGRLRWDREACHACANGGCTSLGDSIASQMDRGLRRIVSLSLSLCPSLVAPGEKSSWTLKDVA